MGPGQVVDLICVITEGKSFYSSPLFSASYGEIHIFIESNFPLRLNINPKSICKTKIRFQIWEISAKYSKTLGLKLVETKILK